jgi:Uma2 family endonuclease
MSITTAPDKLMTAEEFLALPDDPNVERMLIRGRVVEVPMTRRSFPHSSTEARIAYLLSRWQRNSGRNSIIASGEAGCYLRRRPDTIVGIDVAVFPRAAAPADDEATNMFGSPPILAVEILSPSDTVENVQDKITDYLAVGVALVWIIDPHFRTVVVHRPDAGPEMFSGDEELIGDPHLPGLKVAVKEVFADL